MTETIWVAVISCLGTCAGSIFGIMRANKLTNYRIEQLEKKVDKHNNFVERLYVVEERSKHNSQRLDSFEELI